MNADQSSSGPDQEMLPGALLSWNQVVSDHGTYAGISTEGGRVKSLLCSSSEKDARYSNRIEEDQIEYVVPARKSLIRAFESTMSLQTPVRVYRRLLKNQWEYLGLCNVQREIGDYGENGKRFLLGREGQTR